MPSPEQIKAAMPAMREWCWDDNRFYAGSWTDDECQRYVNLWYPGGVDQFIADQEEGRRAR